MGQPHSLTYHSFEKVKVLKRDQFVIGYSAQMHKLAWYLPYSCFLQVPNK